jgi:lysophospholipase L1-like esterase/predicted enzyme related to lactoylglutathione lyase
MKLIFTLLFPLFFASFLQAQDWANLNRFKDENSKLGIPKQNENRIVFMGDSITEGWSKFDSTFFVGKPYINRGISGQTTPQMLLRFRQDVINLNPEVVVILAGTNDIARNTGPSTLEMILNNIISMAELAKANNIKVILSSVLPAFDYPWKTGLNPSEKIYTLNEMIKSYAIQNEITYLDYYSTMVDVQKGLKSDYTYDGVHPNLEGYKIMAPLAEKAIQKTLRKKSDILGLRTTLYKVGNLNEAKDWYAKAFMIKPYFDEIFYVGFNVEGYELGLLPEENQTAEKVESVVAYWGVNDIEKTYKHFLECGATENKKPFNVGGELMTGSVKDPWGNVIGLIYNPAFKLPK